MYSFLYICNFVLPWELNILIISISTFFIAVTKFITKGKKVNKTIIITLENNPVPNQTIKIGAKVKTGIIWDVIYSGYIVFSKLLNQNIKLEITNDINMEITKPTIISNKVINECSNKIL